METNEDRWVNDRLGKLTPDDEWQPDVSKGLTRVQDSQRGTRKWPMVAAGTIAAVIGLTAFPAPRTVAERCVNACEGFFVKKQGSQDLAVKDSTGAEIRMSDLKGRVVLLNFWATWCAPCKAEIPWFIEFEQKYGSQGLAIVGVSMDEDGWKVVRPFMDAAKINYRVAVGDDAFAKSFGGVDSLPETLLIDRNGQVTRRHVGLIDKGEFESEIEGLLAADGRR